MESSFGRKALDSLKFCDDVPVLPIVLEAVGKPIGGKRRIFKFSESAPKRAFCKLLIPNPFPNTPVFKFSRNAKMRFGTRGSATWVNHADMRRFSKNRQVKRFERYIPSVVCSGVKGSSRPPATPEAGSSSFRNG
jgi:hypothetical protein